MQTKNLSSKFFIGSIIMLSVSRLLQSVQKKLQIPFTVKMFFHMSFSISPLGISIVFLTNMAVVAIVLAISSFWVIR